MKKIKMILSFILIAALCMTPVCNISAKSGSKEVPKQETLKNEVSSMLDKAVQSPEPRRAKTLAEDAPTNTSNSVLIYDKNMNEITKVMPYYYSKFSEFKATKLNTFYFAVPTGYASDTIVPVHINRAGVLLYSVAQSGKEDVLSSGIGLYHNKACTKKVKTSDKQATIQKTGTYYLKINKSLYTEKEDSLFCAVLGFVSNRTVELPNNVSVISSILSGNKPIYYKIHVNGAVAKVTTQVTTDSRSYVTLCNSKKTAIAAREHITTESGKVCYVLKKGIYYIQVKAPAGYVVAETTKESVTNGAGTSWSGAGAVQVNGSSKSAPMFFNDSTKKAYYFKFRNPKTQKIYLYVDSSFTCGQAKIEFFDAKGSSYGTDTLTNGIDQSTYFTPYSVSYYSSSAKTLPAGTYYVKFTKKTAKTNGVVSVKVKNTK